MKRRRVLLFAPGAIAVVLLAGCAGPTPASSAPPTATTTVAPAPTPTASEVAGPPQVRVPFDCDALYTEATATPLVGVTLTARGGRNAALTSLYGVAERQAGMLDCGWDGGVATDFGPANGLGIVVVPDEATGYDNNVAAAQPAKYHPVTGTAGDKSSYYCTSRGLDAQGYSCVGEMAVGKYWVLIDLVHTVPVAPAVAAGAMQKALERTAATVDSAGPELPAWIPPTGAPSSFCTDAQSTTRVRAAIGDSTATLYKDTNGPVYTAANVGYSASYSDCFWTGKHSASTNFTLVPGGAWAFPGIRPAISVDSTLYGAKFSAWTVPGAGSALVACKGSCEAFLTVGQTAAQIDVEDAGKAATTAKLAKLAAAIKAAG